MSSCSWAYEQPDSTRWRARLRPPAAGGCGKRRLDKPYEGLWCGWLDTMFPTGTPSKIMVNVGHIQRSMQVPFSRDWNCSKFAPSRTLRRVIGFLPLLACQNSGIPILSQRRPAPSIQRVLKPQGGATCPQRTTDYSEQRISMRARNARYSARASLDEPSCVRRASPVLGALSYHGENGSVSRQPTQIDGDLLKAPLQFACRAQLSRHSGRSLAQLGWDRPDLILAGKVAIRCGSSSDNYWLDRDSSAW
jgi:hypothetical protein